MIGKKNVVFGFLFLVLTAALGPLMVIEAGKLEETQAAKHRALEKLQASSEGEAKSEGGIILLTDEKIDVNTEVILAMNEAMGAEAMRDSIKSGPHAHGNLESLLNIAVGITLCFVVVSALFKQLISWLLMIGTVFHSGMLYIGVVFAQSWAWTFIKIGPPLLLFGIFCMGIAVAVGFKGQVVRDTHALDTDD
jgi:uncharacterized membrane protein YgdD (TMEM256/DUF423 family)